MEPTIITHEAANHDEPLVHNWRVRHSSPASASPGHWPRLTPIASTAIRSPSCYGAAALR
jgi:hypothetical protein